MRALSSVGSERLPYKQRVGGSNPSAPTSSFRYSCSMTLVVLQVFLYQLFLLQNTNLLQKCLEIKK